MCVAVRRKEGARGSREFPEKKEVAVYPSTAREEALALHSELRAALREALVHAARVQHGELAAREPLRQAARALVEASRKHLAAEERDLTPLVQAIDAWGDVRRQRLEQAHALERESVAEVSAALSTAQEDVQTERLIRALDGLARHLLPSLRSVERDVLDPDVLRDDALVPDQFAG